MARIYVLALHLNPDNPVEALKDSVVKYINRETWVINISQLENDIRQEVSSNRNHIFCERIVNVLRQRLENSSALSNIAQLYPVLSDLPTPIELFLRILRISLEKENNDW